MSEVIWIQTYTGKRVNPLALKPDDICIEDIAHALSLLCRFNGHCRQFYSVAEHSIRVAQVVGSRYFRLAALLHDAAEAYLSDVPRPLKHQWSQFCEVEDRAQAIIDSVFGVPANYYHPVKRADDILLATEGRDLMGNTDGWYLPQYALEHHIEPYNSETAEQLFLLAYGEYTLPLRGGSSE